MPRIDHLSRQWPRDRRGPAGDSPRAASGPRRARRARPAGGDGATVEIVRPERHTVRRSVGEPGQLQAFETTAIHAKIPGYVQELDRQHRRPGQEGPGARRAVRPRAGRELKQKQAAVEQAIAKHEQAEGRGQGGRGQRRGCRGEARGGAGRHQAGRGRPRPLAGRVPARRATVQRQRGQTGSLLDETRNKLRSSEASRDEVRRPGQDGRSGRDPEPGRARPGPVPTWPPRPPPSRSPGRTPTASRPCSATPRSRPPSTASSPSGTSTPAT